MAGSMTDIVAVKIPALEYHRVFRDTAYTISVQYDTLCQKFVVQNLTLGFKDGPVNTTSSTKEDAILLAGEMARSMIAAELHQAQEAVLLLQDALTKLQNGGINSFLTA